MHYFIVYYITEDSDIRNYTTKISVSNDIRTM